MRGTLLVLALAGLMVGCYAPRTQVTSSDFPSAAEQGTFALIVRGDTTVLEDYTRTARLLEGLIRPQVRGAAFGWARYRVEFDAAGAPERAEVLLGRVGTSPDAAPAARWNVEIGGGVLEESSTNRASTSVRAPPGVVPVFAPSMVMHHELLRQVRRPGQGHAPVAMPVFSVAADGRVSTYTIARAAPGMVMIAYENGQGTEFFLDDQGRVIGSRTLEGEFVSVRVR